MHTAIDAGNSATVASGSGITANLSRQVMSSIEIAELLGKRHDNVKRTIEDLAAKRLVHPQAEDEWSKDKMNRPRATRIYKVGERDSYVIVAQLSPEFTSRLVDRWQELEGRVVAHLQVPTTFAEALRLAAEQVEQNQQLQQVIEKQAPKVAAIQRLAGAGGAICITDAAKHLQVPPSKLFAWLQQHRWIFHRNGSTRWIAYQPRISAGLMVHKVTALKPDAETGADRAAYQPLVTPKGLALLAEKNIGASL